MCNHKTLWYHLIFVFLLFVVWFIAVCVHTFTCHYVQLCMFSKMKFYAEHHGYHGNSGGWGICDSRGWPEYQKNVWSTVMDKWGKGIFRQYFFRCGNETEGSSDMAMYMHTFPISALVHQILLFCPILQQLVSWLAKKVTGVFLFSRYRLHNLEDTTVNENKCMGICFKY